MTPKTVITHNPIKSSVVSRSRTVNLRRGEPRILERSRLPTDPASVGDAGASRFLRAKMQIGITMASHARHRTDKAKE
jgi:hypothetical protein